MKRIKNLESRFLAFAKSLPNSEYIDDLPLDQKQAKSKKGDFFFNNRSVVCEIKSLKKDTSNKVDSIIFPHRDRPEWPLFYGEWKISKILAHLPDGEQIGQKIVEAISSAIPNSLRDANRQVRETKGSFHLPDAEGLLVLLNDAVDILSPHIIVSQIQNQLAKRISSGEMRFQEISIVWIIDETHTTQINEKTRANPLIMVINDYIQSSGATEVLVNTLFKQWAEFEGFPLITQKDTSMQNLSFEPNRSVQPSRRPLKRYEIWQKQYRASPYLRNLSQDELIDYGEEILRDLNRTFILNSPKKPKRNKDELALLWTHLLEEITFRGIDMRKLQNRLKFGKDGRTEDII